MDLTDPRWWTALVALAALGLTLYNLVELKRKPGRERQQQLRDELRNVLQPLTEDLRSANSKLSLGRDIGETPTGLADAPRRLGELAFRFKELSENLEVETLSLSLRGVAIRWDFCLNKQRGVQRTDDAVQTARSEGLTELVDTRAQDRQEAARRRDAAHRDLATQVRDTQTLLSSAINKLNAQDRGL